MLMMRRRADGNAADDGVFLVPADNASYTDPDSVRQLEPAELAAMQQTVAAATLPEILYTASVLVQQRNCPVDVVNSILAFAGLFLSFESETRERVYGHDNMDDEYVRLELPMARDLALPAGVDVARCVCVAVECESKDQGWTSEDPTLNGTYNGSYTWLDVSVQRRASAVARSSTSSGPVAPPAAPMRDEEPANATAGAIEIRALGSIGYHEPARLGNPHAPQSELPAASTTPNDSVSEVTRVQAISNVRAYRKFRHHVKWFSDPAGLVQSIALGDTVRLVLRSQYPGWTNSARFGRVRVLFALELDEAFSSATVPFPEPTTTETAAVATDADADADGADITNAETGDRIDNPSVCNVQ